MTAMMMYLLLVIAMSYAVKFCGTFSMARIQPSGVAAEMISRITALATALSAATLTNCFSVSSLYTNTARIKAYTQATTADSVGVKMPDMTPPRQERR